MQPNLWEAPAQGRTQETLASSQSGAVCADQHRSKNIEMLRKLWREPRTLNQIAELSGLLITSVCSLRDAMKADLEFAGYQEIAWPNRKPTKRCLWKMRNMQ